MSSTIKYVIGDKFHAYANSVNVFTFTQFIRCGMKKLAAEGQVEWVIGQGLSTNEIELINLICARVNITMAHNRSPVLASSALTHKVKEKNIMITEPGHVAGEEYLYCSQLVLNDDCAEMSDHVSGQHIQGMVLIEAARQMMLAVAEKYVVKEQERGELYCALLKVNTEFKQFSFPLEIDISHRIETLDDALPRRYSVSTVTDFIQNEKVIAQIRIDYLIKDRAQLLQKEAQMAKQALHDNMQLKLKALSLPVAI